MFALKFLAAFCNTNAISTVFDANLHFYNGLHFFRRRCQTDELALQFTQRWRLQCRMMTSEVRGVGMEAVDAHAKFQYASFDRCAATSSF